MGNQAEADTTAILQQHASTIQAIHDQQRPGDRQEHVQGLMDGKTTSSTKLYYGIASGVWFTMSLILLITFLILILGDFPIKGLEAADSD